MPTSKMFTSIVIIPDSLSIGARAYGLLMIVGSTFASVLSLSIMLFFPFIHAEMPPSATIPDEDKIISYNAVVRDKVHAHSRLGKFTLRCVRTIDGSHVRPLKRSRSVRSGDSSYPPSPVDSTNAFLLPSRSRSCSKSPRPSPMGVPPLSRVPMLSGSLGQQSVKFDDSYSASSAKKPPRSLIARTKSVDPFAVAAISTLEPKNVINEAMDSARFTFQFKPIILEDPPPRPASFTPGGPFCESPELGFGAMLTREIVLDDVLDGPQRRHAESIE
uniref:Uncharacterized protein n=1 Tax=Moniliophthora roreri TaxID=221103 RepID=A0A0W0G8L5_MONRR